MADKRQLIFSILEFLEDEIKSGTLEEEAVESIEVSTQCLETAYGINTRDHGVLRPDRSLREMFKTVYGIQVHFVSTKQISWYTYWIYAHILACTRHIKSQVRMDDF